MTVDLIKMKPNAFIRLRNGEFYTVTKVKPTSYVRSFDRASFSVSYGDGYQCIYGALGNMGLVQDECDIVDYVNLPEGEDVMSLLHTIMKLKNFFDK